MMKEKSIQVAEIRRRLGLSQDNFAKEIGFSRSYVGDIESGRTEPSRHLLLAIKDRFGIPVDEVKVSDELKIEFTRTVSEEEHALLNILRCLDREGLQDIFALAVAKAKRLKGPRSGALEGEIRQLEKKLE
jgi:putative transcriptional regulator